MEKNKKVLHVLMSFIICTPVMAMETINDQDLSDLTGQSGLSIGIGMSNLSMSQLAVIDNDGIPATTLLDEPGTYKSAGALVFSSRNAADNIGVKLLTTQSGGSDTAYSNSGINLTIDADGNSGRPFLNIGLKFGSDLQRIKISPFSIYLANQSAATSSIFLDPTSGTALKSGVIELLRIGNNGIDINFMPNKSPYVNFQLGNAPQNKMFLLGGAIKSICSNSCIMDGTNTITLVSGTTGLSLGFKLEGTNASTGFLLDGFYGGVTPTEGLVFGNIGTSSELNLNINNMTLGDAAAAPNIGVFDGLKNGSVGNMGANGVSVTNMKMAIKGM